MVGLAGPRKAQGRKGGGLISVLTDVLVADAELFLLSVLEEVSERAPL